MAKVEITVPGERIIEEFTALVPQPTVPSTAKAPDVGLVELSYVQPTELIPGPPGPPGIRGSRWTSGVGDPVVTTGNQLGDMYLDDSTGDIWTWNGTAWVNTGTNLTPDPPILLEQIKTVDGPGSGLDADLLDGQNGTWYLDRVNHTNVQAISTVSGLQAALDLKAPLASPALTGNPTAPTPTAGDADTSIATTAFVGSAINTAAVPPATVLPLMDGAAAVGTVLKYAKEDHRHPSDTTRITDAPSDGLTYGRKNATWATIVGGAVISDTVPGGPLQNGQLWWESDSGNTFIYYNDGDSSQWVQQNVMSTEGVEALPHFIQRQFITASGSISLHTDTKAFMVEVQGGGASGGYIGTNSSASQGSAGGGGGGGGYSSKWIIRTPTTAPTATVAAAAGSGSSGGTTTYSDGTNTLTGGGGNMPGQGVSSTFISLSGGSAGAGSGGDINISGEAGQWSQVLSVGTQIMCRSGPGGNSQFGRGGNMNGATTVTATTGAGQSPNGYGAGGGGAYSINAGGVVSSGSGAAGCVVITEFR